MDESQKRFLLLYEINDYAENGGGLYAEYYYNISDVENKMEVLLKGYEENVVFTVIRIGKILTVKPVDIVRKYRVEGD